MTATRTLDGVELPTPGIWTIDPGHAEVAFIGRHFMLTKVRGRFTGVQGAVTVAADPARSRLEVTIDMASVDSIAVPATIISARPTTSTWTTTRRPPSAAPA